MPKSSTDYPIYKEEIAANGIPEEIKSIRFDYCFTGNSTTTGSSKIDIFQLAKVFRKDLEELPPPKDYNAVAKWYEPEMGGMYLIRCDSFATKGFWQNAITPAPVQGEEKYANAWYSMAVMNALDYLLESD